MTVSDDIAIKSTFSPNFDAITPSNPFPVIANIDYTAFIIPMMMDPENIYWRLQAFLQVDYYENMDDGEPDKPLMVIQNGSSNRSSVFKRGIKQIVTDATPILIYLEKAIVKMNDDHLLMLMDDVEGYKGPLVIRGIGIRPMPEHAANIIESEM